MPRIGAAKAKQDEGEIFTEEHLTRFEKAENKAGGFMRLMQEVNAMTLENGTVEVVEPSDMEVYWKRYVIPTIGEIDISACPGGIPYMFWRKLDDAHIQWKWKTKKRANVDMKK